MVSEGRSRVPAPLLVTLVGAVLRAERRRARPLGRRLLADRGIHRLDRLVPRRGGDGRDVRRRDRQRARARQALPSPDEMPDRWEIGTLPFGALVGLAAAADYTSAMDWAAVRAHEDALPTRTLEGLAGAGAVRGPRAHQSAGTRDPGQQPLPRRSGGWRQSSPGKWCRSSRSCSSVWRWQPQTARSSTSFSSLMGGFSCDRGVMRVLIDFWLM